MDTLIESSINGFPLSETLGKGGRAHKKNEPRFQRIVYLYREMILISMEIVRTSNESTVLVNSFWPTEVVGLAISREYAITWPNMADL